jgi:hypothetical protein
MVKDERGSNRMFRWFVSSVILTKLPYVFFPVCRFVNITEISFLIRARNSLPPGRAGGIVVVVSLVRPVVVFLMASGAAVCDLRSTVGQLAFVHASQEDATDEPRDSKTKGENHGKSSAAGWDVLARTINLIK